MPPIIFFSQFFLRIFIRTGAHPPRHAPYYPLPHAPNLSVSLLLILNSSVFQKLTLNTRFLSIGGTFLYFSLQT
jgi:hypothetical protein